MAIPDGISVVIVIFGGVCACAALAANTPTSTPANIAILRLGFIDMSS
jgi:hypothetical protein